MSSIRAHDFIRAGAAVAVLTIFLIGLAFSSTSFAQTVDLSLTSQVNETMPDVGEEVLYSITLFNAGPDTATGVGITDILPAETTFVSAAASPGTYVAETGRWFVGILDPGATAFLSLRATINMGTASQVITNTATVTELDQPDSDSANDSTSVDLTVGFVDLEVTKTVNNSNPTTNEQIVYTITVTNHGPIEATGINVFEGLPTLINFGQFTPSQGTYVPIAQTLGTWALGSLDVGANATLQINALVTPDASRNILTNAATISSIDQADIDPSNNSTSLDIAVRATDLTLSKSVSDPMPDEGDTVTFNVGVDNISPGEATAVRILDLLPTGVTFVSSVPSQGTYDDVTGRWELGTIPPGGSDSLLILAEVDPGTGGDVIFNSASLDSLFETDVEAMNDTTSTSITVLTGTADLNLTNSVNATTAAPGAALILRLDILNEGPVTATNVIVTNLLPPELTFILSTPSRGSYNNITGEWDLGDLTPQEAESLELLVAVNAGTAGSSIVSTATAVGDQIDTDSIDNTSVVSVEITPFVNATVGVVAGSGPSTGVAWADFDADGDADLHVGHLTGANQLLRNDTLDSFVDVAAGDVAITGDTNGAAWADFDNDGDLDLYVTENGPNRLLRNDAGTFVDATPAVMVGALDSRSAAWSDYDRDGDVDLYLANFDGANQLFRNDGSGDFVDAAPPALADASPSTGVAWGDYDRDLDTDLFVANHGTNRLFRNDGVVGFVDITASPLDDAGNGYGVAWGDYDTDGDLDLYLVNDGSANHLYRNDGDAQFVDVTAGSMDDPLGAGRSAAWGDYDKDRDLDLIVLNQSGEGDRLFRNDGGGDFAEVAAGILASPSTDGVGTAWSDYDDDGDLDVFVANDGQPNVLLRNDENNANHWFQVDLVGTLSNVSGIGAQVFVVAGGQEQVREVSGGSGYLSCEDLVLEFGLGTATVVDSVMVFWPSGVVDKVVGPAIDQTLQIVETNIANSPPTITGAPGDQQDAERDFVFVIVGASDAEQDPLTYSATGLPPGVTLNPTNGRITGTIPCGSVDTYDVTVFVTDNRSAPVPVPFQWTIDPISIPQSINNLSAVQVLQGNDLLVPPGTTQIQLDWTGVGPGLTVWIYRKGFGGYPLFDDGGGSLPTTPLSPSDAVTEGWSLIPVSGPTDVDVPGIRDFFYYVTYVTNECGVISAASNQTGGALSYHLGDVSTGNSVGPGNTAVSLEDLSVIGDHYGETSVMPNFFPDMDIGPTSTGNAKGRPLTDGNIDFEDLIVFTANFEAVSKGQAPAPASANRLTLRVPETQSEDGMLDVALWLEGDGQMRGLSAQIDWDSDVVEPTGQIPGELMGQQSDIGLVLSPRDGVLDAALTGDSGIRGEGLLATMRFRVLAAGDPGFGWTRVDARSLDLEPLAIETVVASGATVIPRRSELSRSFPNPFNPRTQLLYGVGASGQVSIKVYGLDGRLVRTLVDAPHIPGTYEAIWDGTDDRGRRVGSGVYVARLQAPDRTQTRRMTLIK